MPYDFNQLEKLLLVVSLGLTEAIKANALSIDDAEKLLYSPRLLMHLQKLELSDEIVDLVHRGTELEDVDSLLPERLSFHLSEMSSYALKRLKVMPDLAGDGEKWYENLIEVSDSK